VDPTNRDHARTVRAFRAMLKSLQFTMPCFYCRQSFGAYLRDIPIDNYSGSRREMMRWLYLVHDRVNQKLIEQEQAKLAEAQAKLRARHLPKEQERAKLKALRASICRTRPSQPFAKVLAEYERQRA
jgi:hypothetical protein